MSEMRRETRTGSHIWSWTFHLSSPRAGLLLALEGSKRRVGRGQKGTHSVDGWTVRHVASRESAGTPPLIGTANITCEEKRRLAFAVVLDTYLFVWILMVDISDAMDGIQARGRLDHHRSMGR